MQNMMNNMLNNEKHVKQVLRQKHLGMLIDSRQDFYGYLRNVSNNVNRSMELLSKLQNILPKLTLLTIKKSFILA